MKVLKSAEQKSASLAMDLYTEKEIDNLEYQGYIFRIDENDAWRVEWEFYQTVAKHIDGTELYINL